MPACAGEPAERQLAERRLVALAEQLEDVRALREVVVRGCGRSDLLVNERRGCAGTRPSWPACVRGSSAASHVSRRCSASSMRPAATSASHAARSAWMASAGGTPARLRQLVGHRERLVVGAAPDRQLDAEHLERPLVPAHRLRAVGAVGLAGLAQVLAGALVRAAHQVNLRQRVEHRAGRLVELNRAADFERAREDLLGALEIAELHEDLAERRERDGEAVSRAERSGAARRCARRAPAPGRADGASARRSPGCARCPRARRRREWPSPGARPGAARRWLRRCGRTARAAPPTASARARDGADRRRHAAPRRLRSGGRGRCPSRRPACSRARARSGRGRSRAIRARARRASARACAARSRATVRRARR